MNLPLFLGRETLRIERLLLLFLFFSAHLYSRTDEVKLTREEREHWKTYEANQKRDFPYIGAVPNTIHFIWVGEKPFPKKSIVNLKKWKKQFSSHHLILWSEYHQPHIPNWVEQKRLQVNGQISNVGERAFRHRLEVLHNHGGIYSDHDAFPKKALTSLIEGSHFFVGVEGKENSLLGSRVHPSTYFMASIPNHPIIKAALSNLKETSKEIIPTTWEDEKRLILERTFRPLFDSIWNGLNDLNFQNKMVDLSPYIKHYHQKMWENRYTDHQSRILNRVIKIEKIVRYLSVVFALSVLGLFSFILASRIRRRRYA